MRLTNTAVGVFAVTMLLYSGLCGQTQGENENPAVRAGTIAATSPAPAVPQPYSMQPDLLPPEVPDNYRVGPDDLLAIFVFQMPELTSQVRVGSEGQIRLPLVPRALNISGLTAPEIGRLLSSDLRQEGLASAPVVRVVVRQVMSRPITLAGAVRDPEVIQASRPIRLIEAIARAGGLSSNAGAEILLTSSGPDGRVTKQIPVAALMNSADLSADPLLMGGEVVRIVPAQYVYAVGALQKPDAFPVTADRPMTVLRVLALSQGLSTTSPANLSHASIIRSVGEKRERIPVNLNDLLKHSEPDVMLQPGDIFYVPTSGKRKVLDATLALIGQAATIAIGYRAF